MATPIQAVFFYLATAIDATQTSIPVRGLKDSRGNSITAMPVGATLIYATIEPRSSSNQEIISFTGITDNGNGLVTLTGVTRNLNPQPPFTALAGVVSHGNNAEVILSNSPAFYNVFTQTDQVAVITVQWVFPTPTLPFSPATKEYVDSVTIAGGVDASTSLKGISKLTTTPLKTLGTATITIASPAVVTKATHGLIAGDTIRFSTTGALPTGLAVATDYYVIATGLTANDFQLALIAGGTAINTSGGQSGIHTLYRTTPFAVGDDDTRMPTQGENDAMVGKSGSQVGTSNKFLDEAMLNAGSLTDQSQLVQNTALAVGEADATTKKRRIEQSFIAGKTPILGVKLWKKANTGTFTGNVVVSIQADVSGNPSGTDLVAVTIANATYNALTSEAEFTAQFASSYLLNLGTTYWIVVTPSTGDNSNYINLGYQNTNVYANGVLKAYNTTDGHSLVTGDLYFSTFIDPAGKIVTVDTNNKLPIELRDTKSLLALENITLQDAVSLGLSSSTAIGYDSKVSKISGAGAGSNWSDSVNLTVASNTNRAIIVIISCQSSGGASGVQVDLIGGVVPTLIFSQASVGTNAGQFHLKAYRVVNPSVGVNTITYSCANNAQARGGAVVAYSLYNVDQSSPVGTNSAVCSWSAYTDTSIATTVAGSMVLGGGFDATNGAHASGNNIPLNQETGFGAMSSGGVSYRVGLSDTIYPTSTNNFGATGISGFPASFGIEVKPSTTPVQSGVVKASANRSTNPLNALNHQASFLGFALETKTLGNMIRVSMERVISGFSSLNVGMRYYLQNTAGSIDVTAGTVAKLVGIAISATELLLHTEPVPSTPIALSSANGSYVAENDGFVIAISANGTSIMSIVIGVTHSVQSSASATQRELVVPIRKGQSYTIAGSNASYFMPNV